MRQHRRLRAAAVAAIVGAFLFASRHFVVDDGLIYARFLANALAGNGLVFNEGEHVNALTSPLFTYLLLGLSWALHGRVVVAEHVLFGVTFLGACWMAEEMVPLSGVLVASTTYFYLLIGLESSLFLLMLMVVARAYAAGKDHWLPCLLLLTMLTRFEGGLLIPIVGWQMHRQGRWPRAWAYAPVVVLSLVYVGLNLHWYGALLPNSASSKFGQAMSGYWGKWPTGFLQVRGWAFGAAKGIFRPTWYMVPLVCGLMLVGWREMRGRREHALIAPFCLGLAGFYVLVNMPSYHWYYAPLVFFAMIYAVQGVYAAPVRWRAWPVGALGVVLVVAGVTNLRFMREWGPDWDYVNVARWLDANTPVGASVETVELGQIGWYTQRRVIDVLGLTWPKDAEHIAHRDVTSWLKEDKPDYVVVHREPMVYEEVAVRSPEYEAVGYHSGPVYVLRRVGR